MTQHGEQRGHRMETTYGASLDLQVKTTGERISLPGSSMTQTVSERWCGTCAEWVTARGILGALMCPICRTGWEEQ
jgi:hypothetical protein